MLRTFFGKWRDFKLQICEKASSPITSRETGNVTDVSPVILKALLPISFTPSGITISVNVSNPLKALLPIYVTPCGKTIFVTGIVRSLDPHLANKPSVILLFSVLYSPE